MVSPGKRFDTVRGADVATWLWKKGRDGDLMRLFLTKANNIAYKQMDAQGTPAVALDTGIGIGHLAPLTHRDWLPILACHTGQSIMLIQLAAIGAAIRTIDEGIGQFSSLLGHVRGRRGTYEGHDDRWPRERCPATMNGRTGKHWTQLLDMTPTSRATEDWREMHSILLLRPLACLRVIVTKPAILPHLARLHRKII